MADGGSTRNRSGSVETASVAEKSSRPITAISSLSLLSADHRAAIFEKSRASKVKSVLKLLALTLPGFLITLILTAFNVSIGVLHSFEGNKMKEGLETAISYNALQSQLAVERGLSCVALGAAKPPSKGLDLVLTKLVKQRLVVDTQFTHITHWYGTEAKNGPDFRSRLSLLGSIERHRQIINKSISEIQRRKADDYSLKLCAENLDFYTERIQTLITLALEHFKELDSGRFWLAMEGYNAAFQRSNTFKLLRFLVLKAIAKGNFSLETKTQFIEYVGANHHLEKVARKQVQGYEVRIRHLHDKNVIISTSLEELEEELVHPELARPRDARSRAEKAKLWNVKMRVLGDEYDNELVFAWAEVKKTMETAVARPVRNFVTMIILAFFTVVFVTAIVAWYFYNRKQNMAFIREFINSQSDRHRKMKVERQRNEDLLNQMLPKSVGKILRADGAVNPEMYDEVTIFFSDIYAFSSLTSICTPLQIISLLNSLYSLWDDILSRHDCYKVETIADSYVVASGIPLRNGRQHSNEICTLALHFMQGMENFVIPELQSHKLLIRVGIHTGPIATGVVGTKMPRYCLFGDTINTTARLQTSSKPLLIQISGVCKEHLEKHHAHRYFETKRRGVISLKGKGELETFWLLGKDNFHYRLNITEAERRLKECVYAQE